MTDSDPADVAVLYVGDADGAVARGLSERDGLAVRVVEEVSAVLAALGETDCVVSEWTLEGSTAAELATRVREVEPDRPLVTLLDDPADASACLGAGATDCLTYDLAAADVTPLVTRIETAVRSGPGSPAFETDDEYRTLIEHSTDIVTVVDSTGSITYQSPSVERQLGWGPEELLGDSVYNYVHPDDRQAVRDGFTDLIQQEGTVVEDFTYRFRRADGSWAWLESVGSNRKDTSVGGFVFNSRDVTDRQEREEQLARERELLELSLDTIDDVFYVVGEDGRLERWNETFAEVTGYTDGELDGMAATELFEGDDRERVAAAIEETIETGSGSVAASLVSKSGERVPFEFTGARFTDPSDTLRGLVGVGRDVSGRRARERELEQYERIVEAVPDEIYTLDEDGYLTSVIPPADRDRSVAGYEPEELVGEHVSTVMDEGDIEQGNEVIRGLVTDADRTRDVFEMDLVTKADERHAFENHISLLPMPDGEFRGTVGVLRDVSDRKTREEMLEQIRRNVTDVVWVSDPEKESMEFISDAYEDVWGQTPASLREEPSSFVDAIHPADRPRVEEALQRQRTAPEEYDETYRVVRPDGGVRWVHDRASGVYEDGTLTRIVGVATDVTERRERREELERYEAIVRAIPDQVYTMDEAGQFQSVIPPADRDRTVTGRDPESLVGEHIGEVMPQSDFERMRRAVRELSSSSDTERASLEVDLRTPDGERIPHEDHVSLLPAEEGFDGLVGVLRDLSEREEYEEAIKLRDRALDGAPVGIALTDRQWPETTVHYANDRFREISGYAGVQFRERNVADLAGEGTDEANLAALERAVQGESTGPVELVLYRADGSPFWARVDVAAVGGDEAPARAVWFLDDVTEAKEYEQALERRLGELGEVLTRDLRDPVRRARSCLASARSGSESIEEATDHLDRADELIDDIAAVGTGRPRDLSETIRRNA